MSSLRPLLAATLLFSALSSVALAQAAAVQMINQSQFIIHSLFVSPSASNDWGPDQLGDNVINPGGTFTLSGISCGTYDVRLTNPAGETCTLVGVPLCGGTEQWVLTDANLMQCGG